MSPLQKKRLKFKPVLPKLIEDLENFSFKGEGISSCLGNLDEIKKNFPYTFGRPFAQPMNKKEDLKKSLKVGVVLSGGQAAGGHNVITSVFDTIKAIHKESQLYGFLGGPLGVIEGTYKELKADEIDLYRNQGGFDLIGSGRTKIETDQQLTLVLEVLKKMDLDGLIIIGGDDSNTNAAILAEFLLEKGCKTKVVGVPKTIDGDLKNEHIEISFGFDTAAKTYAEMIGNIERDALSAKKYTHFIKLMGRSASHIALECALKTHPNLTLIGEEIASKNKKLKEIISDLTSLVEKRAHLGKNYGVILIPEGLIEFIPEIKGLISELNALLSKIENHEEVIHSLTKEAQEVFHFLPKNIQEQLLFDRDPHGNVQVSHIQTEQLLGLSVKAELKRRGFKGKFNPVYHFFGYEGRCSFPSNFDATYCYALGRVSVLLIKGGFTGYMSVVSNLQASPIDWRVGGVPITSLMHLETRKGKEKPVIAKALVDLQGVAFQNFVENREKWSLEEAYVYPGPIQFEGESEITDKIPISLNL